MIQDTQPNTVSLDASQTAPDDTVSLDTGVPYTALSTGIAQRRSAKAEMGLSNIGKNYTDAYNAISTGNESQFRQDAASTIDVNNQNQRQASIGDALSSSVDGRAVLNIPKPAPANPDSVIEEGYAGQWVAPIADTSNSAVQNSFMGQAVAQIPDQVKNTIDLGSDWLRRREVAQTWLENAQAEVKNQSWAGYLTDQAKSSLPLVGQAYMEYKLRSKSENSSDFWAGLIGDELEKQRSTYADMPFNEFMQKFPQHMQELMHDNPSLAEMYAQAVVGQSDDESRNNDIFSVLGATELAGLAGGVLKYAKLFNQTRTAVRQSVTAAANVNVETPLTVPNTDGNTWFDWEGAKSYEEPKVVAAASRGDVDEAAVQKSKFAIYSSIQGTDNPEQVVKQSFSTYLKQMSAQIVKDPTNGGTEVANRMAERLNDTDANLQNMLNNIQRVNRTPVLQAIEDVSRAVKDDIKGRYAGSNSTVLDVGDPVRYGATNTQHVPIAIGTHDGDLFKSEDHATNFARDILESPVQEGGYQVKQHGLGYYLERYVPVPETSNALRDNLLYGYSGPASGGKRLGTFTPYIPTKADDPAFQASLKSFGFNEKFNISAARTPEETLSPAENANRKIVDHGAGLIANFVKDNDKDILALKGSARKAVHQVLKTNQNMINPHTGESGGYYFKGPGELDTHFRQHIGRGVTEAEQKGYFAWVSNVEIDRTLRAINMLTKKFRRGVESHAISRTDSTGTRVKSDRFDGVVLKRLPHSDDTVLFNRGTGKKDVYEANNLGTKLREETDDKLARGVWKAVEVHDPDARPLHSFNDQLEPGNRVRYVITNNLDSKELNFGDQVPRREGGHWDFDYKHYLKQANVVFDSVTKKFNYLGDTTVMPFSNRGLGRSIGKHLNEVRIRLKNGDEAGARAYHNAVLPMDFDTETFPHFKSQKGQPPRFSLDEPFQVTSKDSTIMDSDNELENRYRTKDGRSIFRDGTRQGSMAKADQVEYTGQRDAYNLHTIEDKGTRSNPVYQYKPADFVDPYDSLQRAMTRIINSTFMDDYKYMSAEHWIQTALPWLKYDSINEVQNSPFHFFMKGELKKDAPQGIRNILESNRKKAQDFIGMPSKFSAEMDKYAETAAEWLYGVGGPKVVGLAHVINAPPLQAIRSMTVHAKLGLFSISSMFTQSMAMTNAIMLAPQHAVAGVGAMFIHQWSRFLSEDTMKVVDKLMENFGHLPGPEGLVHSRWKPGQLKEARDFFNTETNFFHVGGEHAVVDSPINAKPLTTWGKTIGYWGMAPFREGAQAIRMTAGYMAYLEKRASKPHGGLTEADKSDIMFRASDFDHNMSRSSNSALNSGAMSIPAMFYTYPLRMMELFTGKRLTRMEKARLFAGNAVLWGVPGVAGLSGLPIGDWIRKQLIQGYVVNPITGNKDYIPGIGDGYVNGQSKYWDFIAEGLPNMIGRLVSGGGDYDKGTSYNFSKWGVDGWNPISEFTDVDHPLFNAITGAVGSTMANTWQRSSGFRNAVMQIASGTYPMTGSDIASMFKEVSSFSQADKVWTAIQTGKWMSNNAGIIEDNVSWKDAIFRGLLGVTSVNAADTQVLHEIQEDRTAIVNRMASRYSQEYHRALIALSQDVPDGDLADEFMTRANFWMTQIPVEERGNVIDRTVSQFRTLVDSARWDLMNKNVPPGEEEQRQNQYQQYQDLKDR